MWPDPQGLDRGEASPLGVAGGWLAEIHLYRDHRRNPTRLARKLTVACTQTAP
jgi:hypothetical protein